MNHRRNQLATRTRDSRRRGQPTPPVSETDDRHVQQSPGSATALEYHAALVQGADLGGVAQRAEAAQHLQHVAGNSYVQSLVARAGEPVAKLTREAPSPTSLREPRLQRDEMKPEEKAAEPITLTYGSNANTSAVSSYTEGVLQDILKAAGLKSAEITSTARTPEDQARAMYNNLESKGVKHQKKLYGAAGDKVIDVYAKLKKEKKSADEIKTAMKEKIDEIGPAKVSRHCADSKTLNVVDIAPSSIKKKKAFVKAAEAESRVSKFLQPPADPAYHLEIPQK